MHLFSCFPLLSIFSPSLLSAGKEVPTVRREGERREIASVGTNGMRPSVQSLPYTPCDTIQRGVKSRERRGWETKWEERESKEKKNKGWDKREGRTSNVMYSSRKFFPTKISFSSSCLCISLLSLLSLIPFLHLHPEERQVIGHDLNEMHDRHYFAALLSLLCSPH